MQVEARHMEIEEVQEIERVDTGIRLVYTLLFLLVAQVVETVLITVIAFELGYSLLTRSPPPRGVRRFANQVISYFYRIGRYLTYNSRQAPFPFQEFPEEVEPTSPTYGDDDED